MICWSVFESQNLPLPPIIHSPFQPNYMCDPSRIYPFLPEYSPPPFQSNYMCDPPRIYPSSQNTPPCSTNLYVRLSHNLPLPPRIYTPPPFQQVWYYATLPESTPPSPEYTSPFQQMYLCDPPRIYPFLSEYSPPFLTKLYVWPSQNLPLPPRIYPPVQPINRCDPPIIYPSLPEYTPLFNSYDIMRPS